MASVVVTAPLRAQTIPGYALDDDVVLHPDFSTVETVRLEQRVETQADLVAKQTVRIPYQEGAGGIEILEALTLKRDGFTVRVGPDAIQIQTLGAPGLPPGFLGFSDLRQAVVIFPDLELGDRTVLLARIMHRLPTYPGGYAAQFAVPAGPSGADARVTIHPAAGLRLNVAAQGFTEDRAAEDGARTWHYQAGTRHSAASLLVSTWPDQEAMAASLAPGFFDAMTVTPELQALADRLTDGSVDPTEQVRRIYGWVSREIRYVDLVLGRGGLVPPSAEAVLHARYGDCKGHSVLFATLLKAKGIVAWPVVIGLGDHGYALTTPPTLNGLDHAIVHVPALGLWADTTLARVPFGSLHFSEYGKPVLVMSPTAPRVDRIPPLAPGAARFDTETEATLDAAGTISGTTRIMATGPFVFDLRSFAAAIGDGEAAARQRLRMLGYDGNGSYQAHDVAGFGDRFMLDGRFRLAPRPDRLAGTSFRLPPGL
ncbi:MAG: DUF3857 and transglutaminase domain-containing protein, partial [Rhodospirillales bacterium]|nr:DUF3857 and transglutaminase domain-containing protein [Rhodospirillales bacterium]